MEHISSAELLDLISEFNFQNVPDEWTKYIWETNFNDSQPLQHGVMEEIMDFDSLPRILNNCSSQCRRYVRQGGGETFWRDMAEGGRARPFIAYLCYLIDYSKNAGSSESKRNALLAADTYISLCAIKGANAYHMFNGCLFQKSLETLKAAATSLHQQRPAPVLVQHSRGRGVRGRGRAAVRPPRSPSLGSFAESNRDDSSADIDPDELKDLIRNFLKTIWLFLGTYSLMENAECVESLASCLCRLLSVTSSANDSTIRAEGEYDLSDRSPTGLAFAILHKLFECEDNGRIEFVARFVFKNLMPHLLMVSADGRHVNTSTIPAALVHLRDLVMNFIVHLVQDKSRSVAKLVYVILQHLCMKVTDKADYRAKVSQVIITLVLELPNDTFQTFLQWLNKYSRNSKMGYRAFAIDIVSLLFNKTLHKVDNMDGKGREEAKKLLELCLHLIVGRCSDKAATVRCRALSALTQIMEDATKREAVSMEHPASGDLVNSLLLDFVNGTVIRTAENEVEPAITAADVDDVVAAPSPVESIATASVTTPTGADCSGPVPLLTRLLRRCDDEKTLVRKAAIQAVEYLALMVRRCLNEDAISMFRFRCMDVALSVRKQAMESLTTLLLNYHGDLLEKPWLTNVLALVVDRETSVQEKCVDAFRQAIISNLHDDGENGERAWRLLDSITLDSATTRYAQRVLKNLQKQGSISNQLIKIIETSTSIESKSVAAWFLLSELAENSRFDLDGLIAAWERGSLSANLFNYVVKVIATKAKKTSATALRHFDADIKHRLETFALPTENIAEAMNALWQFASIEKRTAAFYEWCKNIGKRCVDYLSRIVFSTNDDSLPNSQRSDDDIVRRLFMLGELFQLCSSAMINERHFYMMVAFVASDKCAEIAKRPESSQREQQSTTTTTLSQESGESPNKDVRANIELSASVRSHAVIALGKLCLQDEGYAKKSVAVLVVELDSATDFSIRNNIIIILSDLCLRYTSLIDRHLSRISRRLRDPSSLVRKQTLTLLTNLLKEDYLKWRGALLFRFLTALLDADAQIRAFAEFCLINILAQRQPAMFYLHFLECLFYFNDSRHPSWYSSVDIEGGDDRKEEFALSGKENRNRRLYLYRFMLTQFNDEQRFKTTTRICHDILGAVVDEIVPLDQNSDEVIADSLIVLSSKEMKLTSLSSTSAGQNDDPGEDVDPAAVALAEAAKKAISQAVKQTAIEHIIPTLMSLKHIFQRQRRCGLERLLVVYLMELTKDYKNEMKEFLAQDKILLKEIEYDLNRQEKNAPVQLPPRLY